MKIVQAKLDNLKEAAELFDLYRQFYKQVSDLEGAESFLKDRLVQKESVIFLAFAEGSPVGFAQLYPAFSSVSMKRTWILNDLYVKKEVRRHGFGEGLLNHIIQFAAETGTKGLLLETTEENVRAQALYEKVGFVQEENRFYFRTV